MRVVSSVVFVGLLLGGTVFSQEGAYLFTWHGVSNFFQGSFVVTESDLLPGHGFTSGVFADSALFSRPDGLIIPHATSAGGSFPSDGSGLAGLSLDLWFVDDGPSIEIRVSSYLQFGSPPYVYSGGHGIGSNPANWRETGFWTYRSISQKWSVTTGPIANWTCIAASADGTRVAAAGLNAPVYTSTNSGETWRPTSSPSVAWRGLACSSNGKTLVGVDGITIYTSTNSGATWAQFSTGNYGVYSAGCSMDGTKVVALASWGSTFASFDSGATWTQSGWIQTNSPPPFWMGVTCSADATKLVGVQYYGPVCISTNFGTNWTPTSSGSRFFSYIACSADAAKLLALDGAKLVWISTNVGASWRQVSTPGTSGFLSAAFSKDGSELLAAMNDSSIYASSNAGASWSRVCVPGTGTPNWSSEDGPQNIALSADTSKIISAVYGGGLYTWQATPALSIGLSGGDVILSWPAMSAADGWVLEESFGAGLPNRHWSISYDPPANINGRKQVNKGPPGVSGYFRILPMPGVQ